MDHKTPCVYQLEFGPFIGSYGWRRRGQQNKAGRAAADNGDNSFRHVDRIERSIHGASPLHGRPKLYASLDRGFPK
jgi:hypothetical protein